MISMVPMISTNPKVHPDKDKKSLKKDIYLRSIRLNAMHAKFNSDKRKKIHKDGCLRFSSEVSSSAMLQARLTDEDEGESLVAVVETLDCKDLQWVV